MSILRPRWFTYFNCKLSHLSLRKWRGLRRKSRGYRRTTLVDEVKRYPHMIHDDLIDTLCTPNNLFEALL